MDVSRVENLPPPPGIINSIKAGFDAVATNLVSMLFPLFLNLFLWLGPRLQMDALFNAIKPDMIAIWQSGGISAEDIERALRWYETAIPSINLFWLLRTIPIGISSLPFSLDEVTPLGVPSVVQVGAASLFGWVFLLNLAGWALGGLYFLVVANAALGDSAPRVGGLRAMLQSILASVAWTVLLLVAAVPVFLILAIMLRISPFLGQLLVILLSLASMWVIVPLFFMAHGIFVHGQNVVTSSLGSFRLMRFNLPTSSLFVLTVFLMAVGLNFLWRIPPLNSWMTLVGIFGHSFVTTALLAGSFIYYRDAVRWASALHEKLKAGGNAR